jgi:hypothetical protein
MRFVILRKTLSLIRLGKKRSQVSAICENLMVLGAGISLILERANTHFGVMEKIFTAI